MFSAPYCNPPRCAMIDDAQLKRMEAENIACGDAENEWLVRNARRYLALRKVGVQVPGYDFVKFDRSLDAAADRLLEGGE